MLVLSLAWIQFSQLAPTQSQEMPPGSVSSEKPQGASSPLYVGITVHRRPVTTSSPEAQRYFDQGLNQTYAFNHEAAIRSFEAATKFDPTCAMTWWGIALCHGPHINNPAMDEPHSVAAWRALQQAQAHSNRASPVEQALIRALCTRYLGDVEENIARREELNRGYAEAMRQVTQAHPADTDVAVLCAEALMDLRPWDLWSDDGQSRPETAQVLALLEAVLETQPGHPGANHLYIHAVEASPAPQRAVAAADRLRTLMPGSGHMVHMPAHIDVRTGKWSLAADQNDRAIEVDRVYRAAAPPQGFYQVYMLHNPHFLAFACMMEGRRERALEAARGVVAAVPADFLEHSAALADPFMSIEYQVLVRFGQWDQLLALPAPPRQLPMTIALWHFSRATALAAQGNVAAAERAQALFRQAAAAVPEEAVAAINPVRNILKVGEHTLAGEIAFRRGDIDTAVAELQTGVEAERQLLYMEPPEWIQPVRHSLGAVLVAAQRWDAAEQVYRADLAEWPENGWSLWGLARCLSAKGDAAGAQEVTHRFRAAWARADTTIDASCLCVSGPR